MIITVTLNAAIDKRYVVKDHQIGEVNRVTECEFCAGGKGINVSKNLKIAGEEVIATGFIGGHAGAYIEEQVEKAGIRAAFTKVEGESRSCINIYDETNKTQTEFLEPGITISKEDTKRFLNDFTKLVPNCDAVSISGSVPKGLDSSIYKEIISITKKAGKPVILDTSGKLLEECIDAAPTMIKPNQDEIEMLLGEKAPTLTELCVAARKIQAKGIEYVVVSLGKDGSMIVTKDACFKASVPKIQAVNTVGCGDSMTAGFTISIVHKTPLDEAIRYASAISAANAMRQETGFFIKEDMETLLPQIKVEKLSF